MNTPIKFLGASSILSDSNSYVPTLMNVGSATNVDFRWQRVGNRVRVFGSFKAATANAGAFSISLPAGLSIDSSGVPDALVVGIISTDGSSTTGVPSIALAAAVKGSSTTDVFATNVAIGGSTRNLVILGAAAIFAGGETYSMDFSVPIAGW